MVIDVRSRKEALSRRARELGFSACGVAEAAPLHRERALFEEWLARGNHDAMHWMARDTARRCDPGAVLPGARSVVVCAANYWTGHRHCTDPGTARISRYAWGDDYHDVLLPRLRSLASWIDSLEEGAASYCTVDTGPVLEKAWAVRAGIGWLGKNACVLNAAEGSWFFLGVVLSTVAFAPSAPVADRCGSCVRCIEACPTGAITAPGVVDARRCIANLTIERRDAIPEAEGMDWAGWVFGCDTCQDVCPWNSFARITEDSVFYPRPWNLAPTVDELEQMDDAAFRARFRGGPVTRARPAGVRRNAGILRRQASRPPSPHADTTS